jgi:hypothetical protein
MSYIILALPVVVGLSLIAKRLNGQASPRVTIGIVSALLWSGLLAANWVSPGVSSQLLPQGLNALVFVLLFASTMLDWIVQAFRSKLRPSLSDAFVFLLIAALPPVAYAASHFARPVCQDSFQ